MPEGASVPAAARSHTVVANDDVKLDVICEGRGPAVVLIPSSGRGVEDFDDVAEGLAAAGYRVLRPQPRVLADGGEEPTLRDLANDVASVITATDCGPAVVVGHAFGSWIARMLATEHPRLVRGVVLAAAASRFFPRSLVGLIEVSADPARPVEMRVAALREAFFAPGSDPSSWLEGWYPEVIRYQMRIIARPNAQEWWSAGRVPILDLQAAQDSFRPRDTLDEIRDELGERVAVAVIQDASHALLPEQPEQVVQQIRDWIRMQFFSGDE